MNTFHHNALWDRFLSSSHHFLTINICVWYIKFCDLWSHELECAHKSCIATGPNEVLARTHSSIHWGQKTQHTPFDHYEEHEVGGVSQLCCTEPSGASGSILPSLSKVINSKNIIPALHSFPLIPIVNMIRWPDQCPPSQDYPFHIASAACEWIMSFSFIFFFYTYINEFKVRKGAQGHVTQACLPRGKTCFLHVFLPAFQFTGENWATGVASVDQLPDSQYFPGNSESSTFVQPTKWVLITRLTWSLWWNFGMLFKAAFSYKILL